MIGWSERTSAFRDAIVGDMLTYLSRLAFVSMFIVACAKGYTEPAIIDARVDSALDVAIDVASRDTSLDTISNASDASRDTSADATSDRSFVDVAQDQGVRDQGVRDQGVIDTAVDAPSSQEICGLTSENTNLVLNCPVGMRVSLVLFASYGLPVGTCSTSLSPAACHYLPSQTVVVNYCADRRTCTIPATNAAFGDDCTGSAKRLAVRLLCVRE